MKQWLILAVCLAGSWLCAVAQPVSDDLPQVTGCIALINANVINTPASIPTKQNVIIRDGLITHIGPQAKIPSDAYPIQADSLYVYAAFIDACSHIGIKEPENENRGGPGGNQNNRQETPDADGNISLEGAGITPFKNVRATFDPKEKSIADWRAQGFGIAHVVPRGRMIPGQGSLVVLGGTQADRMLWKENVSMYGQWQGASGSYPSTVIGVRAKWRELYHNASQNLKHSDSYAMASAVPRPQYNQAHQAMMPLVKKEMPLYFRAQKVKDISRALAMQQELGCRMVIADAEEAWMLQSQFKTHQIPVVLSLDLPEEKAKEKEEAKDKAEEKAEEKEEAKDSIATDPEKMAFEKRRAQSLKEHLEQAASLQKAGIPFSYGTINGKSADFAKTMQRIIENGLSQQAALDALTLQPAKLLGIDKYCGTVEQGKMANMIVSNKPMFEKDMAIRYMIIEGMLYEYEIKAKKKPTDKKSSDVTAASMVVGTWSYEIEMPDQKREGTFYFAEKDGEITGTISSAEITSGNNELEDIVLDGNNLSFTYELDMSGQTIHLEFDLKLAEDSYEGNVTVKDFGTYPLSGTRTTKPE
jgi:imidazolonepropionase-like amidohydrolase